MRQPFHLMAKPTSYQCNLDCDYCFYLEKERYFSDAKKGKASPRKADKIQYMSDEVLRTYTKQYIASQDTQEVLFTWQGGEPTLAGLDFFKQALAYQKKFSNGKQISNSFQTNGVLLNDEWCEFLKENNFLVGLSIDGPEELHDHYRISQGGKPTFSRVMKGIECMQKHGVEFNTLTVVNDVNVEHPLRVYRFLKEIGSQFQQFIPVVEQVSTNTSDPVLIFPKSDVEKVVTPFTVPGDKYGDFMVTIFDEWVRRDVGQVFIQLFDNALASWLGQSASLCLFLEECGRAMVIERNGDIYSCDHYVYPEYKLGNMMEEKMSKIADGKAQKKFGQDKANVGAICEACEYRFACNGGCPKHRIYPNADGTRQNHLCPGYKKIFKHIDPYMKYMAHEYRQQRAPASVMTVADQIASQNAFG